MMSHHDQLRYLIREALEHLVENSDEAAIDCLEAALEVIDDADPQPETDLDLMRRNYQPESNPDEDGLDDDQMGTLHEKGWN